MNKNVHNDEQGECLGASTTRKNVIIGFVQGNEDDLGVMCIGASTIN
jgi:hypothetical protein